MKKIKYLVALSAAAALLFSCTEKELSYVAGKPDQADSYRVSFPAQKIVSSYEIDPSDASANTVTIKATRQNTQGKITVPLVIQQVPFDKDFVFENTDLVFEDGASTASFQVSFPNAEVGVEYSCHIMVEDPAYAWSYSPEDKPYVSFSFLKVQWETLATGTLQSYFAKTYLTGEANIPNVKLQHCVTFPERYRIADPYYGSGTHIVFTLFGKEKKSAKGLTYYNVRVAPTETTFTYPNKGLISFQDVGYWQGNDAYAANNVFYPDMNYVDLWLSWFHPGGVFDYDYETFVAD